MNHRPSRSPAGPAGLLQAFYDARGDEGDKQWAGEAFLALRRHHIAPAAERLAILDAARLVADSGESADALFGQPEDWAADQVEAWRADGAPHAIDPEPASVRGVLTVGMVMATVLMLMVWLVSELKGAVSLDYTLGVLTFAPLVGVTAVGALTVWERMIRRRTVAVAALAGTATLAAGVAVAAGVFTVSSSHPLWRGSTWWALLLAAAYAALGAAASRSTPTPTPQDARPLEDDAWVARVAGVLRLDAGFSEGRVQAVVAEAEAHAHQAGRPLAAEFGDPVAYASQFAPDRRTQARRRAWWVTAAAICALPLALGDMPSQGWSWGSADWRGVVVFVVVMVLGVAPAWQNVAHTRQDVGRHGGTRTT